MSCFIPLFYILYFIFYFIYPITTTTALDRAPVVFLKDQAGQAMAHKEAEEADGGLDGRELEGEAVLAQGTAPDEPEVDQGEVGGLVEAAGSGVVDEADEVQAGQQAQGGGDGSSGLAIRRPDGHGGLEQAGAGVEAGHAMARAGDEAEDLGAGVGKVGNLGHKQEDEGLGEVAEDADDDKDHAGKVAVGVADEDAGGEPVVGEEGEGDAEEGQEEVEAEEVAVGGGMGVGVGEEVEGVVEDEQGGDDDGLGDLDAVDAGEDVDAVGGEDGDGGHVEVVEGAEVDEVAEIGLQGGGDDDGGDAEVDKVDDEEGDGGKGGDEELVAPADVEEVVAEAEKRDGLKGDDGG